MKLMELYTQKLFGAIKGLDRIRFRGTIRWLANEKGLKTFMSHYNVLLKNFACWAEEKSKTIRINCENRADELKIEREYLPTSAIDKEKKARAIAQKNNIKNGPICMFSVVESCYAPRVVGNKKTKKLELKIIPRKCTFIYQYFDHPEVGFGHVRIQTWLPLNIHICLNGRHWLEKQLIKNKIPFIKDGNCFPWIGDIKAAQEIMDVQCQTNWSAFLQCLSLYACPILQNILTPFKSDYYWSADETEWATDIMFKSPDDLAKLYPHLIKHALTVFDSSSILRFLGKQNITSHGKIMGKAPREIITDYRQRYEGVRIKHWVNFNSVKMYNKSSNILRVETTINNTRDFRVLRCTNDNEQGNPSWQKMRKGVADLHRRCEISNQSNERYGNAIAASKVEESLKEIVENACNRIKKNKKSYRPLNPWNIQDYKLLTFLAKGENSINGFKNKNLREYLYPDSGTAISKKEKKRFSGRTTRMIKLLRAHGLVRKCPRENRYVLTEKGQMFSAVLLNASCISAKELMEMVA